MWCAGVCFGIFMNEEKWKAVPGFDGRYEASTLGRLRSLFTAKNRTPAIRVLKQTSDNLGYFHVRLRLGENDRQKIHVHRIVALAFLAEDPLRNCINHLDFNRKNNRPDNLEWVTRGDNIRYSVRHRRHCFGERTANSKLTEEDVRLLRSAYSTQLRDAIALSRGAKARYVRAVARGTNWTYIAKPA